SSVVVNYLDENGDKIPAEIQDSTVLNGKVFEPFETEPAEIYGYELDTEKFPVQEGRFEEEQQVVNYYYKLKDSSVILRFVNEKGEELSPDRVIEGKVYDDYTAAAKANLDEVLACDDVYGYKLSEEPLMDNNGKMAESQMTLVYKFEIKDAVVEVQYIDTDGNEIDDPVILEGNVFDEYETSSREIRGYTLVKSPENEKGTFIDGKITLAYCYQANEASVFVNYKSTEGETLIEETLSGKVAQNYTTEAKEIKGYQLTAEPVNATGKFKPDAITVNYVYAPDDTSLIVNYLNEEGKAVADSNAEYGKFNRPYTTSAKDVFGYELVEVPSNATGKYTEHQIIVNYVYKLKDSVVTANYVDFNGNKLAESEIINGKYFEDYKTTVKSIYGYQLTATPSNSRGEFNADEITVDYVYVPKDTAVIVNYVNENGKSIENSIALNGKTFEEYETEAKEIYGYTLTETPSNASGVYADDQIIVNYVYALKDSKVIVNHYMQDKASAEYKLADTETINGKVFDNFNTYHTNSYGYELVNVTVEDPEAVMLMSNRESDNVTQDYYGVMKESTITVNYYYDIKASEVVVKYVDENGKDICPSETIDGKVFDSYSTSAKELYAFELVSTPDNASGEMTEDSITVVYSYKQILNIDTDGDGEPDTNIDTDGDGEPDTNIDTDGDGEPDVNIDTDGEGEPDINIETDKDGAPDVNIDTDIDGDADG
ncbi:MAG: MucBP domain-containing protein, partial [Eubacterium sp.]|nr:MucBP domain-containing protein [Eubacterium sp.]